MFLASIDNNVKQRERMRHTLHTETSAINALRSNSLTTRLPVVVDNIKFGPDYQSWRQALEARCLWAATTSILN